MSLAVTHWHEAPIPVAETKYLNKNNLKEKGFLGAHGLRFTVAGKGVYLSLREVEAGDLAISIWPAWAS